MARDRPDVHALDDRGAEPKAVRRVLRRRHLWMIVIGFLHAALLWYGDIVGAYGLVGLIFTAAFLKRQNKTLIIWAGVLSGLLTLIAVFAVVGSILPPRHRRGRQAVPVRLPRPVLICAPVLAAWGLGLGGVLGNAAVALFAIGVWLLTVLGCAVLERQGRRGPAAWLLRRLAYGRRARS